MYFFLFSWTEFSREGSQMSHEQTNQPMAAEDELDIDKAVNRYVKSAHTNEDLEENAASSPDSEGGK